MEPSIQPEAPDSKVKPATRKTRVSHHAVLITLEVLLLGFVLALVGVGVLVWRLQQSPMPADAFIKPITGFITGVTGLDRAEISNPVISYSKTNHTIILTFDSLQLYKKTGPVAAMHQVKMAVSMPHFVTGRVKLPYVTVGEMGLRIQQSASNQFSISASDTGGPSINPVALARVLKSIEVLSLTKGTLVLAVEGKPDKTVIYPDISFVLKTKQGHVPSGALALRFSKRVDVLGADTLGIGYSLANDGYVHVGFYLPDADIKPLVDKLAATIPLLPKLNVRVKGRARISLDEQAKVQAIGFDVQSGAGSFAWPQYGVAEQPVKRIMLKGRYAEKTKTIDLDPSGFMLKGIELFVSAKLKMNNDATRLDGTIYVSSPVIAVPLLKVIWPENFRKGTREWLAVRMTNGRFSALKADIPVVFKKAPSGWSGEADKNITATFKYTDINLDYHDTLADVYKLSGTGTYKAHALNLTIAAGHQRDLNIKSGTFYIDDLVTPGTGKATLDVNVRGPVSQLAEFLTPDPVHLPKRTDLKLRQATGTGDYHAKVIFPITKHAKIEDVHVEARGVFRKLNVPDVVRGLPLSGGPFTLVMGRDQLTFNGKGQLGGQPAIIGLWQDLQKAGAQTDPSMAISAELQTNDLGRRAFIGSVANQITGRMPVKFTYTGYKNGQGQLKGTLNANEAQLDFRPINFIKKTGVQTSASFTVSLNNGITQSVVIDNITGGLSASKARLDFSENAAHMDAVFEGLKLGETQGTLKYSTTATTEKIVFKGSVFDMRRQAADKKPSEQNGKFVDISANTLYLSDTPLTNAQLMYEQATSGQVQRINIQAKAANAPLSIQYALGGALHFKAENAGAALAAMNITERIRGGQLSLVAKPNGNTDVIGDLSLNDFSIRNAPALAKLINLLSLPGLLSILSADTGLSFSKLQSVFIWQNRPGQSLYQFRDGRTSGASLGLTFEGEVNETSNNMAIQGTAVPLSEVNSLVGNIPLLGDLLTGGGKGGGVFAATYSMKGPTADPVVAINPLSVLAPGLIRRVLFEGNAPKAKGK